MVIVVPIRTPYIKLDTMLKLSGVSMSGGGAKDVIRSGEVRVAEEVCLMPGKKLYPGDEVRISGSHTVYRVIRAPGDAGDGEEF